MNSQFTVSELHNALPNPNAKANENCKQQGAPVAAAFDAPPPQKASKKKQQKEKGSKCDGGRASESAKGAGKGNGGKREPHWLHREREKGGHERVRGAKSGKGVGGAGAAPGKSGKGGGKGRGLPPVVAKTPSERVIRSDPTVSEASKDKKKGGKNTQDFEPHHTPPALRLVVGNSTSKTLNRPYTVRDLVQVNELFCRQEDWGMYRSLLEELKQTGKVEEGLWKLWHADTHLIADDRCGDWKKKCPVFESIIQKISAYFSMNVIATRLNWYRDSSEWKPYHHDAAAVKSQFCKKQNITIAASFGAEREVGLQHSQPNGKGSGLELSIPQPNGSAYAFGRDVNILWKHGILQAPPEKIHSEGRISIICWGWVDQVEDGPPLRPVRD
jgi:hypothetical protein